MSTTSIEWTDEVWNPTTGCTKVSEGCRNCYAERVFPRVYGRARKFTDVRLHEDRLDQPLHWRKPRRVFVDSMSDLFHEDVPDEFIFQVFDAMEEASQHVFQILTKRPGRMRKLLTALAAGRALTRSEELCGLSYSRSGISPSFPPPNVWLGVSCEDQKTADERIPLLVQTPAALRFASLEPLLGPIALVEPCYRQPDIPWEVREGLVPQDLLLDWVIAGGESGPKARPTHSHWVRSIRDQCVAAGVPFFFKQWGEYVTPEQAPEDTFARWDTAVNAAGHPDRERPLRFGKKAAGRELDGRTWDEMPTTTTKGTPT